VFAIGQARVRGVTKIKALMCIETVKETGRSYRVQVVTKDIKEEEWEMVRERTGRLITLC
jgi:hypothetical protein